MLVSCCRFVLIISLPLQTIKAPIEYAYSTALTKYGLISLKVTARPRNKNKNEAK